MACHTYILIVLCSSIFIECVAAANQYQKMKGWVKTVEKICDVMNDYGELLDMLLNLGSNGTDGKTNLFLSFQYF